MTDTNVQGRLGEHINEAISRVLEMAVDHGRTYVLEFNGTELTIDPSSSFDSVRADWDAACAPRVVGPEIERAVPQLADIAPTTLTGIVREAVAALDRAGPEGVETAIRRLRATGIRPGVHVGCKNLGDKMALEWYAGQILDAADKKAWFAMNTIINCCDKFAPEGGP